jgi:hypothetical protein
MSESLRQPIPQVKATDYDHDDDDNNGYFDSDIERNPTGQSTGTSQLDSIRHPIQRGPSKLQTDGNASSDRLLNPQDNTLEQSATATSGAPSPSFKSSRPSSLRHPIQRTKTKLLDHELKKHGDPDTITYMRSQPVEDRHQTVYKNKMARPRWVLHVQAQFWRVLMGLGMFFHRLAPPRPPKYNFKHTIPSTVSGTRGNIDLYFYVPMGYGTQKSLWKDRPASDDDESVDKTKKKTSSVGSLGSDLRSGSGSKRWGGYPVVLNFHGGGFTLGSPMDDARWCSTVVDECNAVVVAVDYRLAPEMPFPTAVEDGVDAVMWVHQHAEELGIDANKIALSGFSSGANMACTVPLRLYDELMGFPREDETMRNTASNSQNPFDTPESSTSKLPQEASRVEHLDPSTQPPPPLNRSPLTKYNVQVREDALKQVSDISLRAVVPWYPSLDYTRTREQRRATCSRKDQELPALFTDLFDESYVDTIFVLSYPSQTNNPLPATSTHHTQSPSTPPTSPPASPRPPSSKTAFPTKSSCTPANGTCCSTKARPSATASHPRKSAKMSCTK